MKKRIKRFFSAAAVAGVVCGSVCAGVMPGVAFADETQVQEGVEEFYKIKAETYSIELQRIVNADEYEKYGQVSADKAEAKAGEIVVIKAVRGTDAAFFQRFRIERTSDGANVTEELLGERSSHNWSCHNRCIFFGQHILGSHS